jgi:hypothetical protein
VKARVLASLGPEVLPIARSRKFQRKANDYKRAYRELHFGEGAVMGKALVRGYQKGASCCEGSLLRVAVRQGLYH